MAGPLAGSRGAAALPSHFKDQGRRGVITVKSRSNPQRATGSVRPALQCIQDTGSLRFSPDEGWQSTIGLSILFQANEPEKCEDMCQKWAICTLRLSIRLFQIPEES